MFGNNYSKTKIKLQFLFLSPIAVLNKKPFRSAQRGSAFYRLISKLLRVNFEALEGPWILSSKLFISSSPRLQSNSHPLHSHLPYLRGHHLSTPRFSNSIPQIPKTTQTTSVGPRNYYGLWKKKNRFLLQQQKDEMGQRAPTPKH